MRVLHVPFTYMPDPAGGTEVYVAALAHELRQHGCTSIVAAPGTSDGAYDWDGCAVRRFPVSKKPDLDQQYGPGDPVALEGFCRILDEWRPDLVHFHALTPGASALAMREVAQRGIPLVFTYHTATVSCVQGRMLRWGEQPCDGVMRPRLCSACVLHGKGVPKAASLVLAALPSTPAARLGRALAPGRLATALQLPSLVRRRHATTRSAWATADRIVVVCDWVRQVLLRNGVPNAKVSVCRQGLPAPAGAGTEVRVAHESTRHDADPAPNLRLAYFGRLHRDKGLQTVVQAIRSMPRAPVSLDIYGVAQGHQHEPWWCQLRQDIAADGRIRLHEAVPSAQVAHTMKAYELIVVPSVWMETGPLVVYEAQAAGVPVIGSDLGGIAEIVRNGAWGKLVPAGSVADWAEALAQLIKQPEIIEAWKRAIPAPRTMAMVALEMANLYQTRLAQTPSMNRLD